MNQDRKEGYPTISSLAAIGDGRSLALLGADAALEWFCPARFDNPPLFWRLLDHEKGGYLTISPAEQQSVTRHYVEETAVVEYEWTTRTGTVRARVCMEWPGPDNQQRLLWSFTGLTGTNTITVDFLPQPDFGRKPAEFNKDLETVEFKAGKYSVRFQASCSLNYSGKRIRGRTDLAAGETRNFCLSIATKSNVLADTAVLASVSQRIEKTLRAWRSWSEKIEWQGTYRSAVVRSAITLKLLIYEHSGAVVAAGTAGLPEDIGGKRNWDYRFTWFRDAGLTLDALFSLGCHKEAHGWAEWMQNTIMYHGMPLQVFYAVDGGLPPSEEVHEHAQGYRNSRPVRSGNAADGQFQLDIYGELLECVFICDTMDDDIMRRHWEHLRTAADFIADNWHRPDQGIWEVRSGPRHFVHSKVASWTGLQRALWLQEKYDLECNSDHWHKQAAAIRDEVLACGVSDDGSRFKRAYDDPDVDASLLLLPRYGFVEGTDQRFQRTVDEIRTQLGVGRPEDGLLRRYRSNSGDGLPGEEGAFIICSFWLVEALARGRRIDEAEAVFQNLLALQGDCGLFAEEINPKTKEQLGNIPQAFSHVGLINAALRLKGR